MSRVKYLILQSIHSAVPKDSSNGLINPVVPHFQEQRVTGGRLASTVEKIKNQDRQMFCHFYHLPAFFLWQATREN